MVVSRWRSCHRKLGSVPMLFANDQRPSTNDYFKYFPNIKSQLLFCRRRNLGWIGQNGMRQRRPHLQERAFGIADTVAFTTFAAFSAFFTSTETICSTVTES